MRGGRRGGALTDTVVAALIVQTLVVGNRFDRIWINRNRRGNIEEARRIYIYRRMVGVVSQRGVGRPGHLGGLSHSILDATSACRAALGSVVVVIIGAFDVTSACYAASIIAGVVDIVVAVGFGSVGRRVVGTTGHTVRLGPQDIVRGAFAGSTLMRVISKKRKSGKVEPACNSSAMPRPRAPSIIARGGDYAIVHDAILEGTSAFAIHSHGLACGEPPG